MDGLATKDCMSLTWRLLTKSGAVAGATTYHHAYHGLYSGSGGTLGLRGHGGNRCSGWSFEELLARGAQGQQPLGEQFLQRGLFARERRSSEHRASTLSTNLLKQLEL